MTKKKPDIRTAGVYYELSVPYNFTKKRYQTYVGHLHKLVDKLDILNKGKDGSYRFGLMVYGIYYTAGKLDEEVEKLTKDLLDAVNLRKCGVKFTKRKVFLI